MSSRRGGGLNPSFNRIDWRVAGVTTLLFVSILVTGLVAADYNLEAPQNTGDGNQERMLKYGQSTLYFYGQGYADVDYSQWETWNHAQIEDPESSASLSETRTPYGPNSQGGVREFTFAGNEPNNASIHIDPDKSITGFVNLEIICASEQNCDRRLSVVLRYDSRDLSRLDFEGPDEDGGSIYSFEFFHSENEIRAGAVFDIRLTFTKGSAINDGYTLNLGQGNFEALFPVLPPEEDEVPGITPQDGERYISPYAKTESGFTDSGTDSPGFISPIVWFVVIVILTFLGLFFAPPISFKVTSIILMALALTFTQTIAPMVGGPVSMMFAVDENDPDVYTPDELAGLHQTEGTFLGMAAGDSFTLWVEYDKVYKRNINGKTRYALGFENYDDALADTEETTKKGREYLQLYFSLFELDPRPGGGIEITVRLVNDTINGKVVPEWATPTSSLNQNISLGTIGYRWLVNCHIEEADGKERELTMLYGEKVSWGAWGLALLPISLLMAAWGAFTWVKAIRQMEEEEWDEDDEDLALDDLFI